MKAVLRNALLLAFVLLAALACKRDELDLDKVSDRVQSERNFAGPLVLGKFSIREFIESDKDSTLIINGDTVSLFIREDSLISYRVSDFAEFPNQANTHYITDLSGDIPVSGHTIIDTTGLEIDTIYDLTLDNSMRIDSVLLNNGNLTFHINNTFRHTIDLVFSSESLKDENGNEFMTTIPNILPNSTKDTVIDVSDFSIVTYSNPDDTKGVRLKFHPIVHINPAHDYILASNNLDIEFGFGDINDFNAAFGFFGFQTEQYDTVLSDIFPEMLEGLEGTFNVTNPKINLVYDQSFGLGAAFDLYIESYYSSKGDVVLDPLPDIINYSTNYLFPMYNGVISWNKNTITNIQDLISFPLPDSLLLRGNISVNEGEDSLTHSNYALWESMLNLGLEIEIPLEFSADLSYADTIEYSGVGDDNSVVEVEKANLEFWFENYFPLGFDADLILYDSISQVNLDTIYLNTNPSSMFLKPAAVDGQGNVIREQVERHEGTIALDKATAESLLNETTHLIIQAHLVTTNSSSAKISPDAELLFHFGLDAGFTLTSY